MHVQKFEDKIKSHDLRSKNAKPFVTIFVR
jgi:hypothetical protein